MNVRTAHFPLGRALRLLAALVLVSVPAWRADAQQAVQEVSGFSVPEYDSEMRLKSMLHGDFARFHSAAGVAAIRNLKVEYYDPGTTNVTLRLTAPHCEYRRDRKSAQSDGAVRIVTDDMVVTGEKYSIDMEKEVFIIRENARVVLKNIHKHKESKGANPND